MLAELFANMSMGLATALTLNNLLFCAIGVTVGTIVGVIPGIGALATISMLFPITFHLDPVAALVMLGGIYYGATYGGSTASILLNLPGTPANAVACLDGYPMAQQGRAGVALFMTTVASFVGGSIGIIILMMFSPAIVEFAQRFGPAEYFALMVMGLIAASVISAGSPIKGIAMVVLGVIIGLVGTDVNSGDRRFTFDLPGLWDGVSLVALAMGLFGVAEVIASVRTLKVGQVDRGINMRSMLPTSGEMRRSWMPMLRGTAIGAFFGALPGTGGTIAAFMSYAAEKKLARDPSQFGKGAIEGLMGPESANNASDQTAFIPTLTLGLPGTATMALMLGVLMMHGIAPGPNMMMEKPALFWGLIMSFWIGNIMLLVLNIPLIGIWVRVLVIPYHLLYPAILVFVCIGVFSVNNSAFDVLTVIVLGALGYAMRIMGFPAAPLLLGFVLGPLMEVYFRRALLLSRGDFMVFFERPLSGSFLAITAILLMWGLWSAYGPRRSRAS
jgi:TctA family transporter